MKYISKLGLIFFMLISSKFLCQSKNSGVEFKKQYQYSFQGQLTSQSISDLENKLAALQFVTMAKIKYKADSQKGEVFLQTKERTSTSESDEGFNLVELKKLLISNNLTPIELSNKIID